MSVKNDIQKSQANPPQHYFMVVAQVVFKTQEPDATPNAMMINAVVMSRDGRIPLIGLGRAQQTVQAQFFEKMQDPSLQIIDVVLFNFCPLGVFTKEEFNAKPQEALPSLEELSKILKN